MTILLIVLIASYLLSGWIGFGLIFYFRKQDITIGDILQLIFEGAICGPCVLIGALEEKYGDKIIFKFKKK